MNTAHLHIQRNFPQYIPLKELGSGSFATVYLVEDKISHHQYAIKKISLFGMCDYQKKSAINQAQLLASLNHQNVIKLYQWKHDLKQDLLFLRMQLATQGDLIQLINKCLEEGRKLQQYQIWSLIEGLAQGLSYIHANKIIHRDIKPANVFLSSNNTIKIADMNVSRMTENGMASTRVGSPNYICPQIWAGLQYDHKCDAWSLGVLIYEMCQFGLPFQEYYFVQLQRGCARQRHINISKKYSRQLQNLINDLLKINPFERISVDMIKTIYFTNKNRSKSNNYLSSLQSHRQKAGSFFSKNKNGFQQFSQSSSSKQSLMMNSNKAASGFRNMNKNKVNSNPVYQNNNHQNPSIHLRLQEPQVYQHQNYQNEGMSSSLQNLDYFPQTSNNIQRNQNQVYMKKINPFNNFVNQKSQNIIGSFKNANCKEKQRVRLIFKNQNSRPFLSPPLPLPHKNTYNNDFKVPLKANQCKSSRNIELSRSKQKLQSGVYLANLESQQRKFKTITQYQKDKKIFMIEERDKQNNHMIINQPQHHNMRMPFQQLGHKVYVVNKQPSATKNVKNSYSRINNLCNKINSHHHEPHSNNNNNAGSRNAIRSPFRSPYAHNLNNNNMLSSNNKNSLSPRKIVVDRSLGKNKNHFDNLRRF